MALEWKGKCKGRKQEGGGYADTTDALGVRVPLAISPMKRLASDVVES